MVILLVITSEPNLFTLNPSFYLLQVHDNLQLILYAHYKKTPVFRRQYRWYVLRITVFRGHTDENGRRKFLIGK